MPFRSVFIAVTISGGLLLAALALDHARPGSKIPKPLPEFVIRLAQDVTSLNCQGFRYDRSAGY